MAWYSQYRYPVPQSDILWWSPGFSIIDHSSHLNSSCLFSTFDYTSSFLMLSKWHYLLLHRENRNHQLKISGHPTFKLTYISAILYSSYSRCSLLISVVLPQRFCPCRGWADPGPPSTQSHAFRLSIISKQDNLFIHTSLPLHKMALLPIQSDFFLRFFWSLSSSFYFVHFVSFHNKRLKSVITWWITLILCDLALPRRIPKTE